MNIFSLIQPHTVAIYDLKNKPYGIEQIPARLLLHVGRFDLFAKLYYIRNIQTNKEKAIQVYSEHIKAFNPDFKEPGCDNKSSLADFIGAFDCLIESFREHDFDSQKSVVPVDCNGIILDGAHRIATLAYYDKTVTIARFQTVHTKCLFDYRYFMNRGLDWGMCDVIATEMTYWVKDLKVACIWPSVKNKQIAQELLQKNYTVAYKKELSVSSEALMDFIGKIYSHQSWTSNMEAVQDKASHCYGRNRKIALLLFDAPCCDKLIKVKQEIRQVYGIGNHSIHITDNIEESRQIVELAFFNHHKTATDFFAELKFCIKQIYWLRLKVFVASLIHYKN